MEAKSVNPPAIIRLFRSEDLEACRFLWVELTEWHRYIYQSPGIGGLDPGRQFDEHLSKVGPLNIWVAEVGVQVVGLVGLIPGEGEAELEPMVVSESYRGLGIGQQLANTAIEEAHSRGIHHIKVRPVARNTAAIGFFHALGFNILGHIELFTDLRPVDRQVWRPGEQIAGKDFKV